MSAAYRLFPQAPQSRPEPLRSGIQELLRPTGEDAELRRLQDQFVENWGLMAESFAMNRALGRVHALVYVSLEPMSSTEIAERLVSLEAHVDANLQELLAYRVIRAVEVDGEQRYAAELDPWSWFHRTVRERRQREFMPAQRAMRELLASARQLRAHAPAHKAQAFGQTLQRIETFTSFVEEGAKLIDSFIALGAGPMVTLMRGIARLMPRTRLQDAG